MAESLSFLIGDYEEFVTQVVTKTSEIGIDLTGREIDHICFRCSSKKEYIDMKTSLLELGLSLLEESMIGGRPISILEFSPPICVKSWSIRCLELACPKPGKSHAHGLEHAEVVVGTRTEEIIDSLSLLTDFVAQVHSIPASALLEFDLKAMHKGINAGVFDVIDVMCSWEISLVFFLFQ